AARGMPGPPRASSAQAGTIYKVAGIYALTSQQEPGARREALRLIAIALRKDPSLLQVIPRDPELDRIRDRPEFRELIRSLALVSQAAAPDQPGVPKERK